MINLGAPHVTAKTTLGDTALAPDPVDGLIKKYIYLKVDNATTDDIVTGMGVCSLASSVDSNVVTVGTSAVKNLPRGFARQAIPAATDNIDYCDWFLMDGDAPLKHDGTNDITAGMPLFITGSGTVNAYALGVLNSYVAAAYATASSSTYVVAARVRCL